MDQSSGNTRPLPRDGNRRKWHPAGWHRPALPPRFAYRLLGIPDRFAPSIRLIWCHRGHDNLVDKRKRELRMMAQTAIEAIEQKAIVQIELSCLQAQTEIAAAGLTSDAAKGFIDKLPTVESLMPALSYEEMAGEEANRRLARAREILAMLEASR